MASKHRGTTPLDRLRERFADREPVCPECGHEAEGTRWQAATSGDRIQYRHVCPSCDAITTRTLRLE